MTLPIGRRGRHGSRRYNPPSVRWIAGAMVSRPYVVVAGLCALAACTPARQVYDVTSVDRPSDVASDSLPVERARARINYVDAPTPTPDVAPARSVDILHTDLDLRLDIDAQSVRGTATHRLVPIRDSLDSFFLHAEGMEVSRVRAQASRRVDVSFDLDSTRLTLRTSRPLLRTDTLTVEIDYTARPMAGATGVLFSGRGMYFIDPDGTDPYRPTQVWTQGQTEDNRRWFPTWDYPNDRMTFSMNLAIPDSLIAFSNGALLSSDLDGAGVRRYRWELDGPPMPAYLAALVVGRFSILEDEYVRSDSSTVPLMYIVEPEFESDAGRAFSETPAMMAAFEEYLGVRYPWPDYKQVAVRDFTAGGMENTGLTVLHEGVQLDDDTWPTELPGALDLISHELAHQWLGNLVGVRDWANISLNEGLATYMEAVYREVSVGRDAYQDRLIRDWLAYRADAETSRRPIVWYGYGADNGRVFDTHAYQKAGRIFGQLRFEIGGDAFRRGLNRFITDNAGRGAELSDFRNSMEEASGRPLVRFFDQWFLRAGHPQLDVEQAYFPGSGLYTVQVTQMQDPAQEPIYEFEVLVEINQADGYRAVHRERVAARDTTFRYRVPAAPAWVRFDSGDHLPAEIALAAPLSELLAMARGDEEMAARFDAVVALGAIPPAPQVREALVAVARDDSHPLVRQRAIAALEAYLRSPGVPEVLADIATDDGDPSTVEAALATLGRMQPATASGSVPIAAALDNALRIPIPLVAGRAAETYARLLPRTAFDAFEASGVLERESRFGRLEAQLAAALDTLGDGRAMSWLVAHVGRNNADDVRNAAARALAGLATHQPSLGADLRVALLPLLDDRLTAVRLGAARGLGYAGTREDIPTLEARRAAETDADVRLALDMSIRRLRFGSAEAELEPPRPMMRPTRN